MARRTAENPVLVRDANGTMSPLGVPTPEIAPHNQYKYLRYGAKKPWAVGDIVTLTGLAWQEGFNRNPFAKTAVTLIEVSFPPYQKQTKKAVDYATNYLPDRLLHIPWTWWWSQIGLDHVTSHQETYHGDYPQPPLTFTVVSFPTAAHASEHLAEQVKRLNLVLPEARYRQLMSNFGVTENR